MPVDRHHASLLTRWPWLVHAGLAVVFAGSLFPSLGQEVALSSHESLVAATARNMLENRPVTLRDGSDPSPYLVPNFNGRPRLLKPPLPYWLVAAWGRVSGGVTEWAARLPSALAALGTVLMLAWVVGRERGWTEGWLAAAALASMVGFLLMARRAMADMPLAFFTTGSLAAAWTACRRRRAGRFGWLAVAGLAAGLAVLAKGPVPLLFLPGPVLVGLVGMWRGRSSSAGGPTGPQGPASGGRRWTVLGVAAGAAVFLAVALPWPLYVWLRVPEAGSIWFAQSVGRTIGELGHDEPPYFYLLRLPVLALPWTYFVLHGVVVAVRRAWARREERLWLLFVGAWLLVPLAAFSAAAGKQDHYLLPALPAAAVYAGMAMKDLFAPASAAAARAGRRAALAHGLAFVAAGAAAAAYVGHMHGPHLGAGILVGGLLAAGGVVAAVLARRRRWIDAQAALVAAMLVAFPLAWTTLGGPIDKAGPARRFGRAVARLAPAGAPAFFLGEHNATVIFYADRPIPLLAGPQALEPVAGRGGPLFVIGRTGRPPAAPPAMRWEPLVHEADADRPDKGFWLFRGVFKDPDGRAPVPLPARQAGVRGPDGEPVRKERQSHD